MNRKLILVIVVLLLAAIVRLYNFDQRLIYGPEQGISLITSAKYLNEKFSLLGQIDLIRDTSDHHTIFSGSLFNYSLVPLQLLFNYDPFLITLYFCFLNLFSGFVLYYLFRKKLGFASAVFSLVFFLFNARMIQHSLFIWIYNYTPLVFVLSLYLCWNYLQKPKKISAFLIGLLSGVGFNLLYPYLIIALVFFVLILIKKTPIRLVSIFVFLIGATIGNLPMILFDLKHQFYHLVTLWQYTLDVRQNPSKNQFTYYHLLPLYPLFALILGSITSLVFRFHKIAAILVVLIYVFLNLSSNTLNFSSSTGMLPGVTLNTFKKAASTIAADQPPAKFNLAVLFDFDTRAHPLRYLVDYVHHFKSQPVEQYTDLEALYVLAPKNYDLTKPKVWELQVYQPYQITPLNSPSSDYLLYKLTK
jgi:hypothetical protein